MSECLPEARSRCHPPPAIDVLPRGAITLPNRGVMSRRTFLSSAAYGIGGVLVAGSVAYWYGSTQEPHWLEIVRVRILAPRLPRAFHGLTVGQISDVHFGRFNNAAAGHAAVDALVGLHPDLIVLTGDLVSRLGPAEVRLIQDEFSRLSAPLGVYAILGNHEHWLDPDGAVRALRRAGLTVLRNANATMERGSDRLYLAGVDDVWEKQNDLSSALSGVPSDACVILLAHEPDFADVASKDARLVLQMSGHSHGGQVRLPMLGAVHLPHLARRYPAGLYQVGAMHLYVNRGIGVVAPAVRINCRPEVTLIELASGA